MLPKQAPYYKPEDLEILTRKYPDLQHWLRKPWLNPLGPSPGRAAYLDFTTNGVKHFQDADSLQALFNNRNTPDPTPRRRLFLLEGTHNAFRDVFSRELDIDPQVWARHCWVPGLDQAWDPSQSIGTRLSLPTLSDPSQTFHVDYCQMMYLNLERQEFKMRCAENGRRISSFRVDGRLDNVGAVIRRVSFWGRKRGEEGWDALIVLDEPFRHAVFQAASDHWAISPAVCPPELFQSGYTDFIKFSTSSDAISSGAPPRTTMFDDLVYYHTRHSKYLSLTKIPESVTVFTQKIIASEYILILHYYRALLTTLDAKLSRRDSFAEFDSAWVEDAWSDLSSFHRRLELLRRNISRANDRMGISKSNTHKYALSVEYPWMDTTPDFLYIEAELLAYRQTAERLLGSFDSLASIVGTRQSLNEAHSVGVLTRLGMVFLPMSFIASLFSMSDHYQPGSSHFWVFFAVCGPAVLLTFMAPWILTRGSALLKTVAHKPERVKSVVRKPTSYWGSHV